MRPLLPLLALAVVAAGCVQPPADVETASRAGTTGGGLLPYHELGEDHDHTNRSQHDASWNVELLGWNPIAPDVSKLGSYNHVNVHGTRAFVSAYSLEAGGQPGLAVFNISGDVPLLTATIATPDVTPIDVHVSDDGKYVVLAGHRDNRANLPAEAQTCTGTPMVDVCTPFVPGGAIVVDVSDETRPFVVDYWASAPSGAHTAKIEQYADGYYVFVASYGFSYASRLASHVEILKLSETPLGLKLAPAAEFFPSEPSGNDGDLRRFVHDMYVEDHPDGRRLMYVSYWDGGVVIVDVTDPASPQEVSAWKEFDGSLYGNVHFARPIGVIGEPGCKPGEDGPAGSCRHVSMAAPEYGQAPHAGEMYILDTTDPAAPALLARWTIPGDPITDENYRFSPHNFDPRGSLVAYSHYHGGVWILDLSVPEQPAVKGYTFPVVPADVPDFEAHQDAPRIWASVWADDGTLYSSDVGTGLFHHRLVSDAPGEAPYLAQLGG